VTVGRRTVARVALVTAQPVARASLGQRAGHFFSRWPTIALIALLLACSLQLAVLRHRATRRRRRGAGRRQGTEAA
jgi:hypothetical protein